VVLVFYPLAFSPVCSHQLPAIQEALPRFEAQGAVVLGVSVDSWYANQAFAEKLGVTFPLLSDFFHEASLAYGVFLPERRTSGRALFVVDREGRIAWTDVAPTTAEVPSQDAALEALVALAPRA
jgi:peroxiredoxin